MRSSPLFLVMTTALSVLGVTGYLGGCKGRSNQPAAATSAAPSASAPSRVPFSPEERDVLSSLVRMASCVPSSCGPISCERVSDGVSKGFPSHVAECRWTDERTPAGRDRCAYVHFSYDKANNRFGELSLSALSSSQTCQPDPAFNAQLAELGYTGARP